MDILVTAIKGCPEMAEATPKHMSDHTFWLCELSPDLWGFLCTCSDLDQFSSLTLINLGVGSWGYSIPWEGPSHWFYGVTC